MTFSVLNADGVAVAGDDVLDEQMRESARAHGGVIVDDATGETVWTPESAVE